MRIYRNLAEGIVSALWEIFKNNQQAKYAVPNLLKANKKWGSTDRKFVAKTIYDICRYWRFHQFSVSADGELTTRKVWNILASYLIQQNTPLPEWDEFSSLNIEKISNQQAIANSQFVLRESIPDWLHEFGKKQLGDVWEKEITSLNKEAEVVLRINKLAVPKAAKRNAIVFVQQELAKEQVSTELISGYPEALQIQTRKSILHTKPYQNGWVEIQDANSQLVAPFCMPQEKSLLIDTCAGAGGKTLHFASLTNNESEIIALDVNSYKLNILQKRAHRAKANKIETYNIEDFPFGQHEQQADVVLIDAPCSGLGTIKRNADKKWKITPSFIDEIVKVQQQLLQKYALLTKSGGYLIYATCSILPIENSQQIKTFLASPFQEKFEFDEEQMLFAHETGFDGFYMARLKRK